MKRLCLVLLMLCGAAFATTYYVCAATGSPCNASDSNAGTSKTATWLHAPGMPNFTGSYTHAAGDQIIFRGGDTWHFGNSGATPYTGGTLTWAHSGNSSTPDYIGVDKTWFAATTWVRPVLTRDNALTTGFPASCTYDAAFRIIDASSATYLTIDNFDIQGECWSSASVSDFGMVEVNAASASNIIVENSYFHGWSMTTAGADGLYAASAGGATAGVANANSFLYNVVDGTDSTAGAAGSGNCNFAGYGTQPCYTGGGTYVGFQTIAYNYFNHLSDANVGNANSSFHDNTCTALLVTPTAGGQHSNCMNQDAQVAGVPLYVYNNLTINNNVTEIYFWTIASGQSGYFFNNVYYNNLNYCVGISQSACNTAGLTVAPRNCNILNVGGASGTATAYVYNNTFDYGNGNAGIGGTGACQPITGGGANAGAPYSISWNGIIYSENNHLINYQLVNASPTWTNINFCDTGNGASCTYTDNGTELFQTESIANGQGYTSSNNYAPTLHSGSTVGAGTNLTSSCPTFSPDSALCTGTSAGVGETSGNGGLVVVVPNTALVTRPGALGNWDIGAYQFTSGSGNFGSDTLGTGVVCGPGCTIR